MKNFHYQKQSKINPKNINNYNNSQQNKILRSKSKNVYQQKVNKSRINPITYEKAKIYPNNINSNNNSNQNLINNNIYNNNQQNNNNNIQRDSQNEKLINKYDLIKLDLLKQENISLKKSIILQNELLKNLHDLFLKNYNKIISLRKKYHEYKKYLEKAIYDEDKKELLQEKMEEEIALKAVEEQIMNEICPNPDIMSYEQLLELEEGVGNVNKGLSKEKINKIPNKPFHKAFFEENNQCIICMENFDENELVKQLPCGHIFHGDCIDHWLSEQKNCPFCKADCIINID